MTNNNISKKFWYSNFNFSNSCTFSSSVSFKAFSNKASTGWCFVDAFLDCEGERHGPSYLNSLKSNQVENGYCTEFCRIDSDFLDVFLVEKITCTFLIQNYLEVKGKRFATYRCTQDFESMFDDYQSVKIGIGVNYCKKGDFEEIWVESNFLYILRDWKQLDFYDDYDFASDYGAYLAMQNLHNYKIMQKTKHKPYLVENLKDYSIDHVILTLTFNE